MYTIWKYEPHTQGTIDLKKQYFKNILELENMFSESYLGKRNKKAFAMLLAIIFCPLETEVYLIFLQQIFRMRILIMKRTLIPLSSLLNMTIKTILRVTTWYKSPGL